MRRLTRYLVAVAVALLLVTAWQPEPAYAAGAVFDTAADGSATSGTTVAVTLTVGAAVTNGALIVAAENRQSGSTVSSVTCTAGCTGTFTKIGSTAVSVPAELEIWAAPNTHTGSVTVTVTFSAACTSECGVHVHSWGTVNQTTQAANYTVSTSGQTIAINTNANDGTSAMYASPNPPGSGSGGCNTANDLLQGLIDWLASSHCLASGTTTTMGWGATPQILAGVEVVAFGQSPAGAGGTCTGASPSWTAASVSQSDVQACLNVAVAGDTVHVPAGSSTWTTGVTLNGVTLSGAGSGRILGYSEPAQTIQTGTLSLTLTLNAGITTEGPTVGQTLTVFKNGFRNQLMTGTVSSWNSSTGALAMNITTIGGQPGTGLSGTPTTGTGTLAAGTYYYVYTWFDSNCNESARSAEITKTLSATGEIQLNWTAVTGATCATQSYKVYRGTVAGSETVSLGVATNSLLDNGQAFSSSRTGDQVGPAPPSDHRWLIASQPQTSITNNITSGSSTAITMQEHTTYHTRLTGIYLDVSTGLAGLNQNQQTVVNVTWTSGGKAVVIDHCWMREGKASPFVITFNGTLRGLVHHCSFDASPFEEATSAFLIKDGRLGLAPNNPSWSSLSTMGTADTTGESNVYVEDSDINAMLNATDCDESCRLVFRYSTMNNSGLGSHGADTSTIGMRHYEAYNLTFFRNTYSDNTTFNQSYWFFVRGGTFAIHDNTYSSSGGNDLGIASLNMIEIALRRATGAGPFACWDASPTGAPVVVDYPAPRQVGFGYVTGVSARKASAAATPGAPTFTATTGTLPAGLRYYQIQAYDANNVPTDGGTEASYNASANTGVTLNWTAVSGASWYRIYEGSTAGGENIFFTATTNTVTDNGSTTSYSGQPLPDVNGGQTVYWGDSEPAYVWNTTASPALPVGVSVGVGDDSTDNCPPNMQNGASFIQSGRDYFTGTVKPNYTPYQYPHPLQSVGAAAKHFFGLRGRHGLRR